MSSDEPYLEALDLACTLDSNARVGSIRCVQPDAAPEALEGTFFEDHVLESDRGRFRQALELVREEGRLVRIECLLTLGGEPAGYEVSIAPVSAGAGGSARGDLVVLANRRRDDGEHSWKFLQGLHRINTVILDADSIESMLAGVLDELLELFSCDRAFLLTPCDPEASEFTVPMERTRPEWPGAGIQAEPVAMTDYVRGLLRATLEGPGATRVDPEFARMDEADEVMSTFNIRSIMTMALRPSIGPAWCLGIHHCAAPRVYSGDVDLFEAIGGRVADALTSLLSQQRLRRTEERFQTLVEHAPEAVVILDLDTQRFVDANANAASLFGLPLKELLKVGPMELSPELQPSGEASAEAVLRETTRALEGAIPVFEWNHLNSRGETIPCEVRLVRLPDPDPERKLLRGSITDISARQASEERKRELEAQLLQAQKMEALGQLTGGVAHDFNNILTVIMGNTELALDRLDPEDAASGLLQEALEATRNGALLTQRLLAFSRKQALAPRAVDLGALIQGMRELLVRSLGETVKIEVVIDPDLRECEADPVQLESAILNLAINARDALPEGGRLTVEATNVRLDAEYCAQHDGVSPGEFVLLAVSDDGVGMDPEVLEQAFDPFFTTKGVGKGSGLGLSMVYGFVRQSHGHVKLYSELGHGSTVKVYLPRATSDTPQMQAREAQPEDPRGQGEWILVVEDDAAVRAFTVTMLEELGYRTHHAAEASEALDLLRSRTPVELLLTDVVLPGPMNGVELARVARHEHPGLRALYSSGYTENAIIHRGRTDAGIELLSKPFSRSGLARSVRDALDRRGD